MNYICDRDEILVPHRIKKIYYQSCLLILTLTVDWNLTISPKVYVNNSLDFLTFPKSSSI